VIVCWMMVLQCIFQPEHQEVKTPNAHAQRRAAKPSHTRVYTNNLGIATVPPVRCSVWLATVSVYISNSTDRERPDSKHTLKRGFGTFPEVYRRRKDVWSKSFPSHILSPC
jgi:hypothetical protein